MTSSDSNTWRPWINWMHGLPTPYQYEWVEIRRLDGLMPQQTVRPSSLDPAFDVAGVDWRPSSMPLPLPPEPQR